MKTPRAILIGIWGLAVVGLAVCLAIERQARIKLGQENDALRRQLGGGEALWVETGQSSNRVAQANASSSRSRQPSEAFAAAEQRDKELARLREEVATLRQQTSEIENL